MEKIMTIATLENMLKPLESPVGNDLLRWLYLHLPPQPLKNKKMHHAYGEAVRILMLEQESLDPASRAAITAYLSAAIPFIESYEKKEFPIASATPEEVLAFLMDQHGLTQYDLAPDLGGQPVVSDVLRGKRRLTREHIERLGKRFGVSPATFYPQDPSGGPAADYEDFFDLPKARLARATYSKVADKALPAKRYSVKRAKKRAR